MTNEPTSPRTAQADVPFQATNENAGLTPAGRGGPANISDQIPVRHSGMASRVPDAICLGVCQSAGHDHHVCIPADIRESSTHIVASAGTGKTTLMTNMFLQDIEQHRPAVFMDSQGDGIRNLLPCIRRDLWPRVIYFNPGDPAWIPMWNPMSLPPGTDPYLLADALASTFARVSHDFGDRVEHILRYACIGLLHIPRPCVMDIYNLLRIRTTESEQLRERILAVVQDAPVRSFFHGDYIGNYSKSDLHAPLRPVSKLVTAGSVSLMLCQPESLIDVGQIIDDCMILLVDLSDTGCDVRSILGSLLLTRLLMTARDRSRTPREHAMPRLSLFIDGARLYLSPDVIENIIVQGRRSGINLCLAHQYLKQFQTERTDVLSTVGCTIIGRLDKDDSHYFANSLQGLVEPEEIMALGCFEMIARIGTGIVRFRTLPPPSPPDGSNGEEIVEESRRRYCRPAVEVRQMIARRSNEASETPNGRLPLHLC